MSVGAVLAVVLQVGVVMGASPLVVGVMRAIRSRLEGREGPSVVQPYRDLRKLLRKERIVPDQASWVFALAPLVVLASTLVVAAVAPFVTASSPLDRAGDLFAVVAMLLLGTVFLALAGLDPGTAFGGMGASREMTIAAIAEPTLLLAVFALSAPAGSSNLSRIVGVTLARPGTLATPHTVFAFVALAIVALAETGRLPVDNPSTHLELTMIHEAMILEYAGSDLAAVEIASWTRLSIFLGLLANLFAPWGIARSSGIGALAIGAGAYMGKILLLSAMLAFFEVFTAKLRLFRVPELLAVSFALAFLSVTAAFFLR